MNEDLSNGYEAVAEDFIRVRSQVTGLATVQNWMAHLPKGGTVLDVGAGPGEPLTVALIDGGFNVCAIDASPKMVAAFSHRFPDIEIACEAAEQSHFFGRKFDGILAVGIVFLLPADHQLDLIKRMAEALKPGGRLLFTAPWQIGEWDDVLTGRRSVSLGADAYRKGLIAAGLEVTGEYTDEGNSYYFDARKV